MHANLHASIEAGEPLSARINLLLGETTSGWRRDIPTYQVLRYKDLYQGIDLKYCVEGDGIKSEFIVRPGADPTQIRLEYDDAEHISIDGSAWKEANGGTKHRHFPAFRTSIDRSQGTVSAVRRQHRGF